MRILVTGAAGFAGGYMLRELSEHGHVPIALDSRENGGKGPIRWFTCDLLDRNSIDSIVAETKPDACIHLAGITFVPEGLAKPNSMLSVNVIGTLNILDSFKALKPDTRILCVSTAHVYGQSTNRANDENSPLRPVTLYAISKAAADLAALGYSESWEMPVMTVRPNNHTGPGQSERFVIPGLLAQSTAIADGRVPPVIHGGNMESERDFTDVRDIVRAYRLLIEKGRNGLSYNLGSGTSVTIRTVLDKLCAKLQICPEIVTAEDKFRPKDRSPVLDTARIRKHTGWQPEISLDETLNDMLKTG